MAPVRGPPATGPPTGLRTEAPQGSQIWGHILRNKTKSEDQGRLHADRSAA
ncbi:Hypothetical predicted protein [Pelobates cultripes]|uniref:Uncharacterized protein n=1 Tax=Pelobates cultripes TaxID=61616 RepID=A0AAD1WA62_PELCU|nr:Hypothetical predicted protein [Pelobates cultripes]